MAVTECEWFAGCHDDGDQDVEHPTLGWVPICRRHVAWLQEDYSPTKLVPPLVARRMKEVAG